MGSTMLLSVLTALAAVSCVASDVIDCGQSSVGMATGGEIISFQFINDHEQDVFLTDSNNTFNPVLALKDSSGQYLQSAFTNEDEAFLMTKLSPGEYIVEMIPNGDGGVFKVDMMCSNEKYEETEYTEGRLFRARRLITTFEDEKIDEWIDNMNGDEINYFYDLLLNGQYGQIMDAFHFETDYGDYGEYDDYNKYYRDYYGYDDYDDDYEMEEMQESDDQLAECHKEYREYCDENKDCCPMELGDGNTANLVCRKRNYNGFSSSMRCRRVCMEVDERCVQGSTDEDKKCCAGGTCTKKSTWVKDWCLESNLKPLVPQGAVDITTEAQKQLKITTVQLQYPATDTGEVKFRKTAGGVDGGKFVVECKGGCEGIDYIKLSPGVVEGQILCGGSFFGEENYASCNQHTRLLMTGSKRLGRGLNIDVQENVPRRKKPEWRKRGGRVSDNVIGRVVCEKWGSCTRGALFALNNFKKGIVDHAENANGCRFTFYHVDEVEIAIKEQWDAGAVDTKCQESKMKECLEQTNPPRNHIMTQMVRKLVMKGETVGAFREYVVDTRGVFGPVTIECLGKNACNGMTILFQEQQNYGYKEPDLKKADNVPTSIEITCAFDACDRLQLYHLNEPGIGDADRLPDKTLEGYTMKKTTINIKFMKKGDNKALIKNVGMVPWDPANVKEKYLLGDVMRGKMKHPNGHGGEVNLPKGRISLVRNGVETVGTRPVINCWVSGKAMIPHNHENTRLFVIYDNMSQLKLALRDQTSKYRGEDIDGKKEWLDMKGYWSSTGNFEKYNDLFVPLHDAASQGAATIAPMIENIMAGTFWAGELAADAVWMVANPLYAIHLVKDLVILANKVNQRMRQSRVESMFMTEWYYDKIREEKTKKTIGTIRAALEKAKKSRSSTKTEMLLRESLSPKAVCSGWLKQQPYKLSGGTPEVDAWEFVFTCNQANQCSSHSECCSKRCQGLKLKPQLRKGHCTACKRKGQQCTNSFDCCNLRCSGSVCKEWWE